MRRSRLIRKSFAVVAGHLVRTVELREGRSYTQRCSLDTYEQVAQFVEEHATEGVTTTMLWESLPDLPCTQVSVALDFLKERGCVETIFRRVYPASECSFEDAMLEFHALVEASSEE